MSANDSKVITILTQEGHRPPAKLTPEQEEVLACALDPELQYLKDVERLYTNTTNK